MSVRLPICGCLLLVAVSAAASPDPGRDDAVRILEAMDFPAQLAPEGASEAERSCVASRWAAHVPALSDTLMQEFTSEELASMAAFFESPGGRKWNQRSAAQSANPPRPKPEFAPGESEEVAHFLSTPAGRKLISGSLTAFHVAAFRAGADVGLNCHAGRSG